MFSAAAPPPITGTPTDPPPVEIPGWAEKLDRNAVGGVAYRAMRRYSYANVGLLANGTAYYLILSLFSVLAFAYGVVTIVGADELADVLTDALTEALPGLVGANGIDPEVLRKTGLTAGAVGLVFLLYGGLGAVAAATSSLHIIYGAPPDPRKFVKAKARQLLVLVIGGILIALSFAASSLTTSLLGPILDAIGLQSTLARVGLGAAGLILGFALDVLILWLLLGWLGGIRPERRPLLIASIIGAVLIGLIKALVSLIISWVIAKPQYGAFAAPLAVLFVFALLSQALYFSASIAAGISDVHRPLEELQPSAEALEQIAPDTSQTHGDAEEPAEPDTSATRSQARGAAEDAPDADTPPPPSQTHGDADEPAEQDPSATRPHAGDAHGTGAAGASALAQAPADADRTARHATPATRSQPQAEADDPTARPTDQDSATHAPPLGRSADR